MEAGQSLIAQLEHAIQSGSKDKRIDTMRRVTDLFVISADRLNDQQVELFDDVLGHLIRKIEGKAIAELSRRLGPISNAPSGVVQRLARHDDIAVAEPILTQSVHLSDKDLVEIANTKTQAHLLAISARSEIGTTVTDVLLHRGDRNVFHKLADNSGANFSERGFATLVQHSERDEHLAQKVGLRLDVPPQLFQELLTRATEAVRSRLLALAGPESRHRIQRVLAAISEDARHEAGFQNEHDYAQAHAQMLAMQSKGELNEAVLFEFAKAGRYADTTAALSLLCEAPLHLVKNLMQSEHREALLIPCKAAGLDWPTARAILISRSAGRTVSEQDIDSARADYFKLSPESAKRVLRFWQVRHTASNDVAAPGAASPNAPSGPKSPLSVGG